MDTILQTFWQSVIKNFGKTKRVMRLVGVEDLFKGRYVAGILFQDDNVGLDTQEVYLVEDGIFNFDLIDLNLEPQGIETYMLLLFLKPGSMLVVKERDLLYFRFRDSLRKVNANIK
jgi:hypothetical protein